MIVYSEQEMVEFGKKMAENIVAPAVIELIGDVGAGKTTIVKGIAKQLKIDTPITSPSFAISKTYASNDKKITLTHFDFYRLKDPGIMLDDLYESIDDPSNITAVEWGETAADVLPKNRIKVFITQRDDGSRLIEVQK